MVTRIFFTKAFIRGLKKLKKAHKLETINKLVVEIIPKLEHLAITNEYSNHLLSDGKTWELHAEPDVLLLYRYESFSDETTLVIDLKLENLTNHDALSRNLSSTHPYTGPVTADDIKSLVGNESLNEARKASKFSYADDVKHRYKVVAADEDDNQLFIKDLSGIDKTIAVLNSLSDEKLKELNATQVYIVRDDDTEIYLKFSNEDGTWDIVFDNIDMERDPEDRDTIFNHIMADLNAESTPDQKALRKISREGKGYVGFEDDEIGFDENHEVIHLRSQSDKPINWAKEVAEFYGYTTSEVKLGKNNYKYIDIFTPGIVDEVKLTP